jgi:hypothetical protein
MHHQIKPEKKANKSTDIEVNGVADCFIFSMAYTATSKKIVV